MNYEEKYNEALDRARTWKDKSGMPKDKQGILDDIFPELKENEDELKWLAKFIEEEAYYLSMDIRGEEDRIKLKNLQKSLAWLEKQGEQKPQGKSALELWKDMRLEVYAQASGNRHEPNYSDETTKMFSLNDIDEIMEKISERKNEQSVKPNPYSGVSFKYKSHTFGMCAREGGVEILIDGELKAFISSEKSFIYPIHPIPNITHKSAVESVNEVEGGNRYGVNDTPYNYESAIIAQKDFAPKQESKFKVGDWVVYNDVNTYQIQEIRDGRYELVDIEGDKLSVPIICEYNLRLWTINDAKEGDVLEGSKDGVILIFRGIGNKEWNDVIDYYCLYDCYRGEFNIPEDLTFWGYVKDTQLKPATKEQRDTLFAKMKESGYEWDAEKKELKKIEDELEIPFGAYDSELQEVTYYIPKCFHAEIDDDKVVIKKGEKPTTWSEEDERAIGIIKIALEHPYDMEGKWDRKFALDWLKSLKARVQPQGKWKPSDEQMDALETAMNKYDAYELAVKVLNKMSLTVNNPIFSTGEQVLTADYEYLCKQLEPIVEAYNILKKLTD